MRLLDLSAVGISALCLIHCLALPLLVSLSPLIGVLAENELAHAAFVAAAAPVSAVALSRPRPDGIRPWWLAATASAAIGLLLLGVIGWPNDDWEVPWTVAGALALAVVHLINWRQNGQCRAAEPTTATPPCRSSTARRRRSHLLRRG
jgi:hypothetical protein